eukprot:scaffold7700_cov115-Skeletonema_marinoi.AAC.1
MVSIEHSSFSPSLIIVFANWIIGDIVAASSIAATTGVSSSCLSFIAVDIYDPPFISRVDGDHYFFVAPSRACSKQDASNESINQIG